MLEFDELPEELQETISAAAQCAFVDFGSEHVSVDEETGAVTIDTWTQGKIVYNMVELRKLLDTITSMLAVFKATVKREVPNPTGDLDQMLTGLDQYVNDLSGDGDDDRESFVEKLTELVVTDEELN